MNIIHGFMKFNNLKFENGIAGTWSIIAENCL